MALTLTGLGKTFHVAGRDVHALSGIDLTVGEGEFVSLVGASGCGKSTLLRIIGGLEISDAGQALFEGAPITSPSRERGIVFQDHRLLPWLNVEDNIRFSLPRGLKNSDALIREKLAIVHLTDFAKAWPHELSGGMAQRAAIARALANQPRLLLLDEPFGALDAMTKIRMQEEILRIWRQEKITMILVTHDIDEAVYLGERVVVMAEGRVRESHRIMLPAPRNRVSAEFAAQKALIYKAFFGEVASPFMYSI